MRIVVIEDHLMFREAICKACTCEWGYKIAGQVGSGIEGVASVLSASPEIVILDLRLPDMSGFDVIDRLQSSVPQLPKFLALSGYCDDYTIVNAERHSVHGFVDKSSSTLAELRDALLALKRGGKFFSQSYVQKRLAQQYDPNFFMKLLSRRECDILAMISSGQGDDEIAQQLGISVRTAQTHRSNILHKLNLAGTPKLISFAIEHGIVKSRPSKN